MTRPPAEMPSDPWNAAIEAAAQWHDRESAAIQAACDKAWVEVTPDLGMHDVALHQRAASYIRLLSRRPTPPAAQELMPDVPAGWDYVWQARGHWFAERKHPTEAGMIQVRMLTAALAPPAPDAERVETMATAAYNSLRDDPRFKMLSWETAPDDARESFRHQMRAALAAIEGR